MKKRKTALSVSSSVVESAFVGISIPQLFHSDTLHIGTFIVLIENTFIACILSLKSLCLSLQDFKLLLLFTQLYFVADDRNNAGTYKNNKNGNSDYACKCIASALLLR